MKTTLRVIELVVASVGCAVFPAGAQALNSSPSNQGEVLLFPYFNVNAGNLSFIGLGNRTDQVKVLKVRFREAVEGEAVFDFQLWLSPQDHWTGVLRQIESGVTLATADNSCTLPAIKDNPNAKFTTDRIPSEYTAGPVLDRISEGHVEIIEMATVAVAPGIVPQLARAVSHIDGVPADCEATETFNLGRSVIRVAGDYQSFGIAGRFDQPTGGLYGTAAVFNPTSGIYFAYRAEALAGFAATPIFYPQDANLYIAGSDHTSDESMGRVLYHDLPDISTPDSLEGAAGVRTITSQTFTTTGLTTIGRYATDGLGVVSDNQNPSGTNAAKKKRDAVTTALMAERVANDYLTASRYDTDWVFSFPGRYLYRGPVSVVSQTYALSAPFQSEVDRATGRGCEEVSGSLLYGREEERIADPTSLSFCYGVNVIALNDESPAPAATSALASIAVRADLSSNEAFGWGELTLADHLLVDDVLLTHIGLPVLGFAAVTDRGGAVARGAAYLHQLSRGVTP